MPIKFGKTGLMLALALFLPACTTTASVATKDALCDQFRAVRWSTKDTVESIAQIKQNNAVGIKICGWKP